ncbi:geraniol 8-hydroxylase-like protein [Tanacetum coccineum]
MKDALSLRADTAREIDTLDINVLGVIMLCIVDSCFGNDAPLGPRTGGGNGKGGSSGVDDDGFIEVKKKKSSVNNRGSKYIKLVSVIPKTTFRPKVNQSTVVISPKMAPFIGKKNVSTSVESISKASTSGMHVEGKSSTHIVDKINRIDKHLMDGKCMLVDEDGKPLEKVDSLGDHVGDDEVEYVDNDMARYLALNSSGVGYGTNSLLEQWNNSYRDADYDYDPYDNDMYEGHEIPDNLHVAKKDFDWLDKVIEGFVNERLKYRESKLPRFGDMLDSLLYYSQDTDATFISSTSRPYLWDPRYRESPMECFRDSFLRNKLDFKGQHFEFIPFGSGRRRCPALPLAHRMVSLIRTAFVYHFDWKLPHPKEEMDMNEVCGLTLIKATPLVATPIPFKGLD